MVSHTYKFTKGLYMKKIIVTITLLGLILTSSSGQSIGLSVGTGTFNYSGVGDHFNLRYVVKPSPTIFQLEYQYDFSNLLYGGLFVGYGFSKFTKKDDYDSDHSGFDNEWSEINLDGINIESELSVKKLISKGSGVYLFLGIGLGYYTYNGYELDEREDSFKRDADITVSGPAQYITFGTIFNLSEKLNIHLKLKKLGLSGIKYEMNIMSNSNEKQGVQFYDIKTGPGITDIGFALGISYKL